MKIWYRLSTGWDQGRHPFGVANLCIRGVMDEAAGEDSVNYYKVPLIEQLVNYAAGAGFHLLT